VQYIFTAVFTKDDDNTLLVSFPDLPGCYAQGTSMLDAVKKAESVLSLCLYDMELHDIPIPTPRNPEEIPLKPGEVTSVILINTDSYHLCFGKKKAEHVVTLPAWLGEIVEAANMNLSQMVQDAVKQEIGIPIFAVSDTSGINQTETPVQPKSEAWQPPEIKIEPEVEPEIKKETFVEFVKNEEKLTEPQINKSTTQHVATEVLAQPDIRKKNKPNKSYFFYVTIFLVPLIVFAALIFFIINHTSWLDNMPIIRNIAYNGTEPYTMPEVDSILNSASQTNQEAEATGIQFHEDGYDADEIENNDYALYNNFENYDYTPYEYTSDNDYEETFEVDVPMSSEILSLAEYYDNKEVVGRLIVGNTNIDYAVVQHTDNEFYRTHDIWGNPTEHGWIFVDSWLEIGYPSNNTVFYGPMIPHSLFYEISRFADFEFFATSPGVRFITHYSNERWEIFAFYTDHGEHTFSPANYRNWDAWIEHFASRSLHPTNVAVNEEDRIITLVANRIDSNERYIIHARLVQE